MNDFDARIERAVRLLARRTGRRTFLARLGTLLVGAAALPLLPVARGTAESARVPAPDENIPGAQGDPTSCEYWRHCAIDGFACACCGGSASACPPGAEKSPVGWIGTCRNPADGNDYVVSYNDCCGSTLCMRCQCLRTEGEKPPYVLWKNNSLLWCFGTKSRAVHCSVSIVLGVAET